MKSNSMKKILGVLAPVLRTGNSGTNEADEFFRQARRRLAAVWGIRQGAATTHGGKRRGFMFRYFRFVTLGTLGLAATGVQAAWDRGGHGYPPTYQQTRAYSQQINARQDRQLQRIRTGQHAGHLTRFEFRELMQEQHRIRVMEQHFRADGVIDAREFRRLDHALDRADRNIRAGKHGRQAYRQKPWY